ncbi:prepilin-type N-terminal cleavage/methylation domain-containing protein [bacterium]|nr:prepilin-type N-terminal cleavage/methylation domain-containing protein [bacterium]
MRHPTGRCMTHAKTPERIGFTLIELLTAMAIVTLLAGISVPIILSIIQGDKIRDASSSVQATITAARERAALDNRPTGIRLISDANNPELVRQIVLIREADPIVPGSSQAGGAVVTSRVSTIRSGTGPFFFDTVEILFDRQFLNTILAALPREQISLARYSVFNVSVYRGVLRLNGTGAFRGFSIFPDGGALANVTPANQVIFNPPGGAERRTLLVLDTPLNNDLGRVDFPVASSGIRIEIARPPVPLEGAEPLNLPQGIVIDLGQLPKIDTTNVANVVTATPADASNQRLSRITPRMQFGNLIDRATGATDFSFDIMFGTDRNVIGSAAVDDRVILWMRDENAVIAEPNTQFATQPSSTPVLYRKEVRADSPDSNSLVVLSTRTGQLGTYKPVLVDENGDGFADWDQYYRNVEDGIGVNDQ